jgi:hypothetical protein
MKIYILTDNTTIEMAAHLFAKYYNDYRFLEYLRTVPYFNHTTDNGSIVAKKLKNANIEILIREYKPLWRWSKAIGYATFDKEKNLGTVFVNTYKIDLPLYERVNNLMHESLHMLGYSHKGNSKTTYNLKTVPYKVGAIFEGYVKAKVEG